MQRYGDEITHDWNNFVGICKQCRDAQFDLVVTHSDAPGNVLQDANGTIYLVDWDEILLAPAERDTWFLIEDVRFMQGYRTRFPSYAVNDLAFRFYLHNRYFEDLLGYLEEILGDYPAAHRAMRLHELHSTCVAWLRPQIRALA